MSVMNASMQTIKLTAIKLSGCTLVAGLMMNVAQAEEGGSGHYLPGSLASSIDATLPSKAFVVRLNAINYSGEIDKDVTVPIAGLAAADVEVDTDVLGLTFAWNPGWDLGNNLSYAMSMTIPFVDLTVTGHVAPDSLPAGAPVQFQNGLTKTDTDRGLGDIILMPLMLSYQMEGHWRSDLRLSFYAPTGDYTKGALANTGKNYWTFEPTVGLFYNNPKKGRDFAIYAGFDFNEENDATDYKTGTQTHVETTYVQHFPLWGGAGGLGATGYYYKQLTGDSGSGATYGDFKGKTVGAGPVLTYFHKMGNTDIVSELKWMHDFDAVRRPEADTIFFKILAKI